MEQIRENVNLQGDRIFLGELFFRRCHAVDELVANPTT